MTSAEARSAEVAREPAPRRWRAPSLEWLLLALIVLLGTLLSSRWALAVDSWRMMEDELTYVKEALTIAETLNPEAVVRGVPVGNYGVLYPALLAPLVGLFDMPTAFRLAHGFGALLMASTAVPAYLLGAYVSRSRAVGLAAAALVVVVPWVLLSLTLFTETVAYPVFVWALYASVVAVAEPSKKRDITVLATLALLFLARPPFLFMFGVVPMAIVVHEVGIRLAGRLPRDWVGQVWGGLRASVTLHPILAGVIAVGALVALAGASELPLGNYNTARTTALFPDGFVQSALDHLNYVLFGIGVLPLALTLAFVGEALARRADRRAHAFAVVVSIVAGALLIVATSFDLGYLGGGVRERYVFYVAPVLLIAAVCYPSRARWPVVAVGTATIATAVIVTRTTFEGADRSAIYSSPASLGWAPLDFRVGQVGGWVGLDGLNNAAALALGTAVAALILVVLLRSSRRRLALAGLTCVLVVWCAALTGYAGPRLQSEHDALAAQALGTVPAQDDRDWIDSAVSPDTTAALVPSAINSRFGNPIPPGTVTEQGVWWEAEFWNKSVRRSYLYDGAEEPYTSFLKEDMGLEERSGRLRVTGGESPHLLVANSNVRLGVDGEVVKRGADLSLYRPRRPYRAAWTSKGVADGGGLDARRGARLTVYGHHASGHRASTVALSLAGETGGRPVTLRGAGRPRLIHVPRRRLLAVTVCVPPRDSRSLALTGKSVGELRLISVSVKPKGPC